MTSAFNRTIQPLEPGPTRLMTETRKLDRERTGFNGSIFLHVDFDPNNANRIDGVRLSEKAKDGSTLDTLLHAIGDELTAALKFIQHETKEGR